MRILSGRLIQHRTPMIDIDPLRISITANSRSGSSLFKIHPVKVDIALGDEDFSLIEYGIPGRVIYTPGHSMGSVSILLDSGEAIIGDLAMNHKLLRLTPGLPIFAEDINLVKESWRKLLQENIPLIYPGHGPPFSPDVIRKTLG